MRMPFNIKEPILRNVDTLGRTRPTTYPNGIQTSDDFLGLPRPLRGPVSHASYYLDYPWAVSHESQILLGALLPSSLWPDEVLTLTSGLDFPNHGPEMDCYDGMVAHYTAVAESVLAVRPALAGIFEPLAARHGLNYFPWGMGWLYESFPCAASTNRIAVPADAKPVEDASRRKAVDARQDPAIDALLVYLSLTGAWRDSVALRIVSPVLRTGKCPWVKDPDTGIEAIEHAAVCFCNGGWPKDLGRQLELTLKALGIKRDIGRPSGHSKWEAQDDVYYVLAEFVDNIFIRTVGM